MEGVIKLGQFGIRCLKKAFRNNPGNKVRDKLKNRGREKERNLPPPPPQFKGKKRKIDLKFVAFK